MYRSGTSELAVTVTACSVAYFGRLVIFANTVKQLATAEAADDLFIVIVRFSWAHDAILFRHFRSAARADDACCRQFFFSPHFPSARRMISGVYGQNELRGFSRGSNDYGRLAAAVNA